MKKLLLSIAFLTGVFVNTKAQSLDFDGANDYVNIATPYTAYTNEITVEVWIKSGTMMMGSGMGQGTADADNMGANVWLLHSNGGTITFFVNDGGTWRSAQSTTDIVNSEWHHVVGVASATETAIYIDGVKENVGAGISSAIQSNSSAVLHLGKDVRFNTASGRLMTGSMDEVRIWNVARTQAEIQNNMACSLSGVQAGLVSNYNFNQGTPNADNTGVNTLLDASGNGSDGTLMNFALNGTVSNWVGNLHVSAISISADVLSIPAPGVTITYTAVPMFGGTAPTYQWLNNGVIIPGANSSTYSSNAITTNDTISCSMTSNQPCITSADTSNTIAISYWGSAQSLDFDGNDDYAISNSNLTHGNVFTYEAWINLHSTQEWGGILTTSSTSGEQQWVQLTLDTDGKLRAEIQDDAGNSKWYDGQTVLTGAWHHVAITFDGTNLLFYVDGNVETTSTTNDDPLGSMTINSKLQIGTERNRNPIHFLYSQKLENIFLRLLVIVLIC